MTYLWQKKGKKRVKAKEQTESMAQYTGRSMTSRSISALTYMPPWDIATVERFGGVFADHCVVGTRQRPTENHEVIAVERT